MIVIKSRSELDRMRAAGAIVKEVLERVSEMIKPGIRTKDIDSTAESIIHSRSAIPSFKGYHGFPAATCISLNEVVVHGFPGETTLKEGDIVSVDVGVFKDGFHGDAARTFPVGQISEETARLIRVTEESFYAGIEHLRADNRLGDVSHAIQSVIESAGFSVVREFFGHGIGRELHEEPSIPNFGKPNRGPRLRAGMVLALEPMVVVGNWPVETLADGWTAVTVDRSLAAHYENTVAVTNDGPEILTV